MKFLFLSDIHANSINPVARKDEILPAYLKKIEFVFTYALDNKAVVLQAGDWFDRPRDWVLLHLMLHLLKKYGIKVYTIYGQHDMYMYSDTDDSPTTMSVLIKAGYFNQLYYRPTKIGNCSVYGCSFGSEIPKPKGRHNILVIHAPIAAKGLFNKHDFTSAEHFAKKNKGYDITLCGDIHRHMIYESKSTTIINTGPMIRRDGSKYNMTHKPSFYIYDDQTHKLERVFIPHEKASKVLSRGHIEQAKDFDDSLKEFTSAMSEKIDFISIINTVEKLVKKLGADKRVKYFLAEVIEDEG